MQNFQPDRSANRAHSAIDGTKPAPQLRKLRNDVLIAVAVKALAILTDTRGMGIGPARIMVSTVGHVPGIRKLARHGQRFRLAVSLHAASDEERSALLPVNRRWPLAEVLEACREYSEMTQRRVLMAWTLIAGTNDSPDHAQRLAALLAGRPVQVNLIPLNPVDGYAGAVPPLCRQIRCAR